MTAWELVAVVGGLFFLGLVRGTTVCVSICVPGLLPYLAERPRNAKEGAWFGILLCLPRLLIFAGIGLVWGAASYTILNTSTFDDFAQWMSVVGYMVLGLVIMVLGLGMFLKAAREKEDLRQERLREADGVPTGDREVDGKVDEEEAPADGPSIPTECGPVEHKARHKMARALSSALLRFVPASTRSERAFVLLWGSILGFTCLIEVSILELGLLGGAAAGQANATLTAALMGAVAMAVFAAGASVPVVIASSAFAAYVDRVKTREKLISLRVTGSLVMVMIGGMLFLRYLAVTLALL
jgi:hypothetical protein